MRKMSRPVFRQLRELKEQCEQILGAPLPHLSMGMSGDFEVAIEEGATIVRIGTALFGPRKSVKRTRQRFEQGVSCNAAALARWKIGLSFLSAF